MKVLSVLQANSVRALRTVGVATFGYLPEAGRALQERYAFLSIPTPEELLPTDPSTGFAFKHGKLEKDGRSILIDFLQVFPTGVSVTTRTNTTDSDIVLNDVLAWAKEQFKLEFEEFKTGVAHSSQLEIRLDSSLPELFPFLSEIGRAITNGLDEGWWEPKPSYELININFWIDKAKYPVLAPGIFRLDRRENVPFEQNVYYSEAPMSTDNHIAVLQRLERICSETFPKKTRRPASE